jgi:hypothetical protein
MAKYGKIFERVDDVVYAREQGSPADTRVEVARNYDSRTSDGRSMREHIIENQLWHDIRRAATTNTTLQSALDHAIMIYKLSKEYKNDL